MITRRSLFAAVAVSLTFVAPVFAESMAAGVQIHDPYARSMGGVGASGAVFFGIMNSTSVDDRLIGVKSDVAQKVELHTHKEDANGVMQMLHVPEGFVVPAGGSHELARGGDHVMLMGLTRELAQGDSFALTLIFEQAGEVVVDVPVDNDRKPDAGGMKGMNHGTGQGHGHGMGG